MPAGDESAAQFVGGTVYQAYLSATNYHRWHSPVSGTIVQDGTYFSEADSQGSDPVEPGPRRATWPALLHPRNPGGGSGSG